MTTRLNTITSGIQIGGITYDLIVEETIFQNKVYSCYLQESEEPEDRERKTIEIGSFDNDQYDCDCAEFYAGGGKFTDTAPVDRAGEDAPIMSAESFANTQTENDAENIVDNWDFPPEVPAEAITEIKERLADELFEVGFSRVENYAETKIEEERQAAEKQIEENKESCGEKWDVSVDYEYNDGLFWQNGGHELWEKFADRHLERITMSAEKGAKFIREAAKIPAYFHNKELSDCPFIFNPADEEEGGAE